jgi:hypothetical protein
LAKKITVIIAVEEKKAFRVDTTIITLVGLSGIPVPSIAHIYNPESVKSVIA